MLIQRQVTINTSADKVWEIVGHRFDRVAEWGSSIHASQGNSNGSTSQDAPCSGRVCETDIGVFKEEFTRYYEHRKSFSYNIQGDKIPFFVKQMSSTWTVTSLSNGQSGVDMSLEVSILPVFNLVMGPMMRLQMNGASKKVLEELKYFAENGVPHPRKLEAQRKRQFKAA